MGRPNAYVRLLRPVHWSKNVFVFAGLAFAEQDLLWDPWKIAGTVYAFAAFCLLSSFAYVVNDIQDIEQDRQHPRKCHRPLAAGDVSIRSAQCLATALFVVGLGMGFGYSFPLGMVCTCYLLLNLTYSYWLKHHVIVDVMCIATGFVLRALAGVMAIKVILSPWLIVCTFTLCLFVGFGKRRCELAIAHGNHQTAANRRPVLARYTLELLGHLLTLSAAVAVITFLLYTMAPETAAKFGTNFLIYTVPLVMYGVFRFAVLIQTGKFDGPIEVFVADRPFQITVATWLAMAVVIVHYGVAVDEWLHTLKDLY